MATKTKAGHKSASLERVVRRDVLVRILVALETAADDAMSYGPSESDADYLAAIAEAKAELEAPNAEVRHGAKDADLD